MGLMTWGEIADVRELLEKALDMLKNNENEMAKLNEKMDDMRREIKELKR